jgi:hypothetical protein
MRGHDTIFVLNFWNFLLPRVTIVKFTICRHALSCHMMVFCNSISVLLIQITKWTMLWSKLHTFNAVSYPIIHLFSQISSSTWQICGSCLQNMSIWPVSNFFTGVRKLSALFIVFSPYSEHIICRILASVTSSFIGNLVTVLFNTQSDSICIGSCIAFNAQMWWVTFHMCESQSSVLTMCHNKNSFGV